MDEKRLGVKLEFTPGKVGLYSEESPSLLLGKSKAPKRNENRAFVNSLLIGNQYLHYLTDISFTD